jgi:hypothetical protein
MSTRSITFQVQVPRKVSDQELQEFVSSELGLLSLTSCNPLTDKELSELSPIGVEVSK